jgi:hypothetical protein
MRMVFRDINVYFFHDKITPENVRGAIYGTADHPSLLPEVGDILHDFGGYMGELITVRVVEVEPFGQGVEAYKVHVTDAR